jgi:hypothetical protein
MSSQVPKRGRGRPRKLPTERPHRALPTINGKRALTPSDVEGLYGLTRSILREIPRSELPRVVINQRVHLYLAEDVETYVLSRRVE